MPEEITKKTVVKLARGLSVSRADFGNAYDELAETYETPVFMAIALEANRETAMPPGPDRDRRDFREAMLGARDAGWLTEFVFDNFKLLSSEADTGTGASDDETQSRTDAQISLQSIANRRARFADGRDIQAGTLVAMRRCCEIMIEVPRSGGDPKLEKLGSGFLIGPNLILTNYHVIKSLTDPVTELPREDAPRGLVRFDFHKDVEGSSKPEAIPFDVDWMVFHSPSLDEDKTEAVELFDSHLDFTVLKLAGRPGDARGYYDLGNVSAPGPSMSPLQIWQFPAERPMKVSDGLRQAPPGHVVFPDGVNENAHPRIYYIANALPGSSGGLVLDHAREPIALHEAGFDPATPDQADRLNRGIPLSLVKDAAMSRITQELRETPPRVGWLKEKAVPVFGRGDFQDAIFAARTGDVRIITVLTAPAIEERKRVPKVGRSFSKDILEAYLPSEENLIAVLNAGDIEPDPLETARNLVAAVDQAEAASLPPPSGETTLDADATGPLVDMTVEALIRAARGRTLWLMIDDIDAHPIGTQWSSSSFLIAFYRRVAVEQQLRVILAGMPKHLEGLADLGAEKQAFEILNEAPSGDFIEDWAETYLTSKTKADEFTNRIVTMLGGLADEEIQRSTVDDRIEHVPCPTEAMSRLMASHGRAAFRRKKGQS